MSEWATSSRESIEHPAGGIGDDPSAAALPVAALAYDLPPADSEYRRVVGWLAIIDAAVALIASGTTTAYDLYLYGVPGTSRATQFHAVEWVNTAGYLLVTLAQLRCGVSLLQHRPDSRRAAIHVVQWRLFFLAAGMMLSLKYQREGKFDLTAPGLYLLVRWFMAWLRSAVVPALLLVFFKTGAAPAILDES